ncbi:MAG: DUF692 domain-containing protein [Pseudomonadota bacterium]
MSTSTARSLDHPAGPIPAAAGIGLRHAHHRALLDSENQTAWLEAHPENYMGGGWPLRVLERLRDRYSLSLHGVGLSLGGADPLDQEHLARLQALVERVEPALVSEHVAWTTTGGVYLNDLLPLPWTEEALAVLVAHIDEVQTTLKRPILIENPSTYLSFRHSEMPEWAFLAEAVKRAGCKLLLDINNVYVSARNLGFDPRDYLAAIPAVAVAEIHLAGHARREIDGVELRIDDHGSPVNGEVWALYRETISRIGPRPTLIEWDSNIPELPVLLAEAAKAESVLAAAGAKPPDAEENRHAAA